MIKRIRKVFKCRKGQAFLGGVLGVQIAAGLIASMTGLALFKTARNGVLKKNGQVIWCKMQNKGNDFCDVQQGHLGNGQYK